MRAELSRPGAPDDVIAIATWNAERRRPELEVRIPTDGLESLTRLAPVVTEDPSRRRLGAHGAVVLQPGDLGWFVAALETRAPILGLKVRFVVDRSEGGWDPASQYRSFEEQVERLVGGAESR